MKEGSDEYNSWRQVQSDVAQMRQALDDENVLAISENRN